MEPGVEQRLIQLLRESPAPALPLRQLHRTLSTESDGGTGSYALFEESLRRRREVFVVLETASPFGDQRSWPAGARSEYERELAAAGFDSGPHVSLVDAIDPAADLLDGALPTPDPVEASLRQLRDSLVSVWRSSGRDAGLRDAVSAALAGCSDLPQALRDAGAARSDRAADDGLRSQ